MTSLKQLCSWRYLGLILVFLLLSACATHYSPEHQSNPYGFFSGIWHGVILPFSICVNIISWCLAHFLGIDFMSRIQIIGRPNTGFFYYFGFVFAMLVFPVIRTCVEFYNKRGHLEDFGD